MLKIRCTDIRQTRHNYSQLTESEKAKFQTPSTSNEVRNYVEHNSVENISQNLVHPTKSDTASASLISESDEREEITETADVPAPTPAPALERVKEQSTLQDPESQQERILEGQPVHIVTFTCK